MITEYSLQNGTKRYMLKIYLGIDPLTGKQRHTTRRGFKTMKEAKLAEARIKLDVEAYGLKDNKKMTFKEVYDLWLIQHKNTVKPGTYATSARYAKLHILPKIGNTHINRFNVVTCQRLVNEWAKHFNSAKYPKGLTQQVLDYAIKLELIHDNPMRKVPLPRKQENKLDVNKFYDSDELKHFFECLDDYNNPKFTAFFRLLAFTGVRKGEALALTWEDIDFDNLTVTINKGIALDEHGKPTISTPKTKKSTRIISIDAKTAQTLKEWRRFQRQELFRLYGINSNKATQLLFTYRNNRIYMPCYVNEWLNLIIKTYNLKHITVHGFRHSHCSLLFEMGTPIQVVQERLGHTNIKTTMDIYTHVTTKARDELADNFAKYVNF